MSTPDPRETPLRSMPDGSPCWCSDGPIGDRHSPRCNQFFREETMAMVEDSWRNRRQSVPVPALDADDCQSILLALEHFPTWFDATAAKVRALAAAPTRPPEPDTLSAKPLFLQGYEAGLAAAPTRPPEPDVSGIIEAMTDPRVLPVAPESVGE